MLSLAQALYQAIIIYDTKKITKLITHYFEKTKQPIPLQKLELASCFSIICHNISKMDGVSITEIDELLTHILSDINTITKQDKLQAFFLNAINNLELVIKRQNRLTLSREVNAAISYMYIHLFDKKSVDDIATHTTISQRHLNQLFQTYTKMSIHQYYLKLKIERASLLIQFENMTTSELAHLFQFYDESHFIRVFKKHYNMSPKQWQKEHL